MAADGAVREVFEIKNRLGLHARAAVQLVQLANQFQAEIMVSKEGQSVSGKSIIGLLTLAAAKGDRVEIAAEGPQAAAAVAAIRDLIERRFDEGE